jgi:hypothetical protein
MGSLFTKVKIMAILIVVIVGLILVYALTTRLQSKYNVNLSSQTVIKQITALDRLETAQYTIEKVIDVGTSGNKFSQILFGDRILLIAHGDVIAGFDLAKLNQDNVEVTGKQLKVHLPAPQILVSKLDNDQTRVYDRTQGLLTKGDSNLETEARKDAENVIRNAACQGGILKEASKNATTQMTAMFKSMGFETVIIDIPDGSC